MEAQNRFNLEQWFQFTLPRGERRSEPDDGELMRVFQFTLPRGERRYWAYR